MLRILNKNKVVVGALTRYWDLLITKRLSLGDRSLEFNALIEDIGDIVCEGYIETENEIFVVKEITPGSDGLATVYCQLDMEALEGKVFPLFESVEQNLSTAISLALVGTGWTVGVCNITKKRTLRKENCNALQVIRQALSVYRCECTVNSKQHVIDFVESVGSDRGTYFSSDLNLRKLEVSQSSYDFYTEIEPYGKDGMTIEEVNNGQNYLSNYTYSTKSKRLIWKDERYTIPLSLKEDAQAKLDSMAVPYKSYRADIVDLAKISPRYGILDYDIGDTITLMDSVTNTREKQRIVEIFEYPDQPERNTCTFANTTLTFEELAQKYSETADQLANVVTTTGELDGAKVDSITTSQISDFEGGIIDSATIKDLRAQDATITGTLTAVEANIGTLSANQANFERVVAGDLEAVNADIQNLNVTLLDAETGRITVLDSEYANIKSLLAGNAAATAADVIQLNASNAAIDTAFLRNLIAANISVNDLLAGRISTNKFTVGSDDGAFNLSGSVMQFKDADNNVRIQIGKDGQGNYSFSLFDASGNPLWYQDGITADGIPDGLIVDDMVADSSGTYQGISASKLNINSVVGSLNSAGGLRSSSIVMDEDNQTLSVAFTNLKGSVDNMSIGGRNLIIGTLNPDVSAASRYPHIKGQTSNSTLYSSREVATHGVKVYVSSAVAPYICFGTSTFSNGSMNGLEAGKTYTLSFDAEWRLFSGDTATIIRYFRAYIYGATSEATAFSMKTYSDGFPIAQADKGTVMSGRFEWTFTVPEDVVKLYLIIRGNIATSSSSSLYASGDYIKVENLMLEEATKASNWSPAPEDYLTEITGLNDLIDGLQDQIDGVIDTYYYDYAPTLNNAPASDWSSTDYPSHKGDMFLDTSTGKSYRFLQDETTQAWSWVEIPDTASAAALVAAQDAKDLADHKRRVFTATPYPPYDEGDLWFAGSAGDILTCINAKGANGAYAEADWSKLNKYTDDSYAIQKYAELNVGLTEITGRVGTVETTVGEHGSTLTTHGSQITQTAEKISKIITDSDINNLPTGTTMYSKLLSVEQTANGTVESISDLRTYTDGQIEDVNSAFATYQRTIDGSVTELSNTVSNMKIGGRNLILGTANPDVSVATRYPHIKGQTSNSTLYPSREVATHGVKVYVSSAVAPYICFGTSTFSNGSMNGLEAGKTYTLSFDAEWRLFSGDTATIIRYFRAYIYGATSEATAFSMKTYSDGFPIAQADKGTVMSGRFEWTFTVPEDVVKLYLIIRGNTGTASLHAAGDYIKVENLMLEEATKASNWSPAPEDSDEVIGTVQTNYNNIKDTVNSHTQEIGEVKTLYGASSTLAEAVQSAIQQTSDSITLSVSRSYALKSDAVTDTVIQYAVNTSPSQAPAADSSSWSTASPTWQSGKYIWMRTAVTKNGQTAYSNVSCIQGAKGENGTSVTVTDIKYAESDNATSPGSVWYDSPDDMLLTDGKYLWTRTTYSDGNIAYSISKVGTNGTNGKDGKDGTSVSVASVQYREGSSSTSAPTGTWSNSPVTVRQGYFLWTRTTYSDGKIAYAVSRQGQDGAKGLNTATIYLYQRASTAPTKPTKTLTYTFATGNLDGDAGSWQQDIPSGTNPCWVTLAVVSANTDTDTIAPAEWTDPVVMVQNGQNGTAGADGYNQASVFLYQRADTEPSKPTGAATYTFKTGALSGNYTPWKKVIPATNGKPCWVISAAAISQTATASIEASAWSAPVKMVEDGQDGKDGAAGANGLNQATLYLYQRATASPAKPSSALTYTFSTKKLSGTLGSWSQGVPDGSNPCWMIIATASSSDDTDSIAASEWTTPVKLVENGKDGKSISKVEEYYCLTNTTTAPEYSSFTAGVKTPSASNKYLWNYEKITYTDSTTANLDRHIVLMYSADGAAGKGIQSITEYYALSTTTTAPADSSFSTTVKTPTATNKYLWNYEVVAYTDSSTPTSTAKHIIGVYGDKGTDGTNGIDGYNQATLHLYKRAASSPSRPSGTLTYTFATGGLSGTMGNWQRDVPDADGNPCWVISKAVISQNATISITSASWSDPAKLVEDGENGAKGVGIKSVITRYALWGDDKNPPANNNTAWEDNVKPDYESGKYYWVQSKIIYDDSDDHIEYTTPICDTSLNDLHEFQTRASVKLTDDALTFAIKSYGGVTHYNLLDLSNLKTTDGTTATAVTTTKEVSGYVVTSYCANTNGGLEIASATFEKDVTYTLSFKFQKKSGTLKYFGIKAHIWDSDTWASTLAAINTHFRIDKFTIDGTAVTAYRKSISNNTDVHEVVITLAKITSDTVRFMFAPNIGTSTAVSVQYWDMQLEKGGFASAWMPSQGDQQTFIQATADAVRLKTTTLVWQANNSSMTEDGKLTINSAQIGGITVTGSAIYSGSHSTYNSSNTGFYLGKNGQGGIGDSNNYLTWDGSEMKFKGKMVIESGKLNNFNTSTNGIYAYNSSNNVVTLLGQNGLSIYEPDTPPTQIDDFGRQTEPTVGAALASVSKSGAIRARRITTFTQNISGELTETLEYVTLEKGVTIKQDSYGEGGFLTVYGGSTFYGNYNVFKDLDANNGIDLIVVSSSGRLCKKSSSAKRYKNGLGEESEEDALKLLDLPVIKFVYKDGYLADDCEINGRPTVGVYADDVEELFGADAVVHDKDGLVENYIDRQLLVRLIKLVQIQQKQIDELKGGAHVLSD